jgi:hypothetical protein
MNLETWARISEITASIAVLITLVVLVFEVRENTEAVKKSSYETLSNQLIDWRLLMTTDPNLHRVFYTETREGGEDWALEGEDRHVFQVYVQALWLIYEQAYYAYSYGDLQETEWQRFEETICRRYVPEYIWTAPKSGTRTILSPRFIAFVESCRPDWQKGT